MPFSSTFLFGLGFADMNEVMNSSAGFLLALAVYGILFAAVMSFFIKRQNAKRALQEYEDYYRIVWAGDGRKVRHCHTPDEVADALTKFEDEDEVLVLKAEAIYNYGDKVG